MLDLLTAAPKMIAFGSRRYNVGALKLRELGLLQAWIREHSERPTVAMLRTLEYLPEEEHRNARLAAVIAERDWPPAVGSREGNRILFDSLDGLRYFLGVMLRKYQPEIPDPEIEEVLAGVDNVDFGALVRIAFGDDDLDPLEARRRAEQEMAAALKLQDLKDTVADLEALVPSRPSPGEASGPAAEAGSTSAGSTAA